MVNPKKVGSYIYEPNRNSSMECYYNTTCMMEHYFFVLSKLQDIDIGAFFLTLWGIWIVRNHLLWEGKRNSVENILWRQSPLGTEWQVTRLLNGSRDSVKTPSDVTNGSETHGVWKKKTYGLDKVHR